MNITQPIKGIYKLEVPFEDIYTAVFAVTVKEGYLLIDSATTAEDVDRHILPGLRRIGLSDPPKALLLTHRHGDHAGGAPRLSEHFPEMEILSFEPLKNTPYRLLLPDEIIGGRLQVVCLPGHTQKSIGYLDTETNTLISGDCLQQQGVGKYTNGIGYPALYLHSIEKLRSMELSAILASHDYVPLGSAAIGKDEIERYLNACIASCPKC
ncbi:MAG: MBL fold metallo-hydrolase [Clostridia bacterium]|nr:MBL fold metallo-hydrolase [Clostridia bacterium]